MPFQQATRTGRLRRYRLHGSERLESRELLAANLVGHWRADTLNESLADGEAITEWTDAVASIPAAGNGQPRLVRDALDGRSVVRFDASNGIDTLKVDAAESPLSGAGDFTIAVVFATDSRLLNGGPVTWFLNTGLVDGSDFFGTTNDWGLVLTAGGQIGAGLGGPGTSLYSSASGLNDGQFHVAIYTRQAGNLSLYVDGAPADTRSGGGTQPRISKEFTIGALNNGQFPYTGDIGEIRIYDDDLTASEAADLYAELRDYFTLVPPTAQDDAYTTQEDIPLVVDAAGGVLSNDANPESDPLRAILETSPEHGTLTLAADGSFEYLPDADFFGSDSFRYRAHNLADSNLATVTLRIESVPDAVTAVPDDYLLSTGTTLSVGASGGVLANDTNPDGRTAESELVSDVTQGSLTLRPDGSFDYDPGNFVGDPGNFVGTTTFQYRVRDDLGVHNTVDVVLRVDTPPEGVADGYDLQEEGLLEVAAAAGVLANDRDAEGDHLTARLLSDVTQGVLTFREDGSFEYRPKLDFFGTDEFTYLAHDGDQDSVPTTVMLRVANVNDRPIGSPDRYFGSPDQRLVVPAAAGVLANDLDIDNGELRATVVEEPRHGSLELATDGSFSYQPAAGFRGADRFTYEVSDGELAAGPVRADLLISNQELVINEILAVNEILEVTGGQTLDSFGDSSDWVEIANRDTVLLDLGGYYLTDDANNLTKWRVPVETLIEPGEHQLVYASGNDLVTSSGELHASFRLAGGGEYLALVRPDGQTIASQIAPVYPPQTPNVSYGLGVLTQTTRLVDLGDTASTLFPTDGSLSDQWTSTGFDATSWPSSVTPLGFSVDGKPQTLPGFEFRFVDVIGGDDGVVNRATEAEAILNGTSPAGVHIIGDDIRSVVSKINFGGQVGTFDHTSAWPNGVADESANDFALRATATVTIPAGDWTIGFGGNDGGILRLDDVVFLETTQELGDARADGDGELIYDFLRNSRWTTGTFTVGPGGLTTSLELIYFERDAGDSLELAITSGHTTTDVTSDTWTLLSDTALGWQVESVFSKPAPEITREIAHDASTTMFDVASSAYLRLPFELTSTAGLDQLTLRMQYDDAFVAYLNGQEVARSGFTGAPTWNSVADVDRPDLEALATQEFDISSHLGLLRAGSNVLAIQGLNAAIDANGFFVAAELDAVNRLSTGYGFMDPTTPGATNGLPSVSVANPPTFSRGGGTFADAVQLELLADLPEADIRYTTDGSLPTSESPRYHRPLSVAESTHVRARVFAPNRTPSPTVGQTYEFVADETFVFDPDGGSLRDFDSDLPILLINTSFRGIGDDFVPVNLQLHETDASGRADLLGEADLVSRGALKIRGSSSSGFPKRPYALELRNHANDQDRDIGLLGLGPDSDWVLYGPYNFDRSFTRNTLLYDLSNQAGQYAANTRFVEVFLHRNDRAIDSQDYVGVYVLTEKLNASPDRIPVEPPAPGATTEPEITGGYILKVDRADPGDTGFSAGGVTLRYVEPKETEIEQSPAQQQYLRDYIADFSSALNGADFRDPLTGRHYSDFIDVPSFVDHHLLNEVMLNVDAFRLSGYFFKPQGGKLFAGPVWDVDRSAESTDGRDDNPTAWYLDQAGPPVWWKTNSTTQHDLFDDLEFRQAYIDRYTELRRSVLSTENILGTIEALAEQVEESQARNFMRWVEVLPRRAAVFASGKLDGSWRGEVEHQKEWHSQRMEWLDSRFLAPPELTVQDVGGGGGLELVMSGPLGASIYYTLNGRDPRLPGGAIAPYAALYTGSIPITENAQLVARSFDATFDVDITSFRQDGTREAWSGQTAESFTLVSPLEALRFSELHYHPSAVTAAEALAGVTDENQFEYVELVNISTAALDLSDVQLTMSTVGTGQQGVAFEFGTGSVTNLGPGERVLVVKDADAFAARYGTDLPVAGAWSGTLSNNREQLTLVWDGAVIQQFTYDDNWHPTTDGSGASLELIDAHQADLSSWNQAASWQPSTASSGTPGVGRVRGDVTADDTVDAADIDRLYAEIASAAPRATLDLTGDGRVDQTDVGELVLNILQTRFGDTNLDGAVTAETDGQTVLSNLGQTGLGWAGGDVDGDGDVTASRDGALLLASLAADGANAYDGEGSEADAELRNAAWDAVFSTPADQPRRSTWD